MIDRIVAQETYNLVVRFKANKVIMTKLFALLANYKANARRYHHINIVIKSTFQCFYIITKQLACRSSNSC
jgi:hypothetical protein